jgi:hypothetical protein
MVLPSCNDRACHQVIESATYHSSRRKNHFVVIKVPSNQYSLINVKNSSKSIMSNNTQIKIKMRPSTSLGLSYSSCAFYHDPLAKQSKTILKSTDRKLKNRLKGRGDGDIWVERQCVNQVTGKKKILFVSEKTGKITSEPPTGASLVILHDEL